MESIADLDVFARIVTAGSMSAAGRELGLSPAVISKRIRRLEERLGTRLLQALAAAARRQGLKHIVGEVLPDNLGMLTLCRNLGFQVSPWASGSGPRLISMKL